MWATPTQARFNGEDMARSLQFLVGEIVAWLGFGTHSLRSIDSPASFLSDLSVQRGIRLRRRVDKESNVLCNIT
jgi:hypothetical protein